VLKCACGVASAAFLAVAVSAQSPERPVAASSDGACGGLKGRKFGDTAVVASTVVPAGPLRLPVTIPDLPSFCRVQAVSRPSADSNINFEVWLPDSAA
jgi:hypothetical protein